eukprot:jgi/Hompol1/3712/HPOL_003327-RA
MSLGSQTSATSNGSHPQRATESHDSETTTRSQQLVVELIALCSACLFNAPSRVLRLSYLARHVRSLYEFCLSDEQTLTGTPLTPDEKAALIKKVIPSKSLARFFGSRAFPVLTANGLAYFCVMYIDNLSEGIALLSQQKCTNEIFPYVAVITPYLIGISKKIVFDPVEPKLEAAAREFSPKLLDPSVQAQIIARNKAIAVLASKPRVRSPVRQSEPVDERDQITDGLAKMKISPSQTSPQTPSLPAASADTATSSITKTVSPETATATHTNPTAAASGNQGVRNPSQTRIDEMRAAMQIIALCLYFAENRTSLSSTLGTEFNDLYKALAAGLGDGVPLPYAKKKFQFFEYFDRPRVVINGSVMMIKREPMRFGDSTLSLVEPDSSETAQTDQDIVIAAKLLQIALDHFESLEKLRLKKSEENSEDDDDDDDDDDEDDEDEDEDYQSQEDESESDDLGSIQQGETASNPPKALDPVSIQQLAKRMSKFYTDVMKTQQQPNRAPFLKKVQSLIDRDYRNCNVYMFGSSTNNLGTNSADVDMCIEVTDGSLSTHRVRKVHNLARTFQSAGMKDIQPIAHARVPICKFYDPEFKLHADINVGHFLGVFNSGLLKTYTLIDPRVKPMIMIVKMWAKARDINNPATGGTVSSYAYSLMVIAYLQRAGVIPSLQAIADPINRVVVEVPEPLQRSNRKGIQMRQVDVSYEKNLNSPALASYLATAKALSASPQAIWESEKGIVSLLYGFARYFGYEHTYRDNVRITVKNGNMVDVIPQQSKRNSPRSLHVEDPFELDRNCTFGARHQLNLLQQEFRRFCG